MIEQFEKWLKEICRWDRDDWFIHWIDVPEERPGELTGIARVYTHTYRYNITARKHEDGHTYLGCTVSCRTPRAGEGWTRGNDLPDGEFSRTTWEQIKNAIIRYELVKVAKPVRQEPDEDPVEGPSIEE